MTVIDSIVDRLKKNFEYSLSYHESQTAAIGQVSFGGRYIKKIDMC